MVMLKATDGTAHLIRVDREARIAEFIEAASLRKVADWTDHADVAAMLRMSADELEKGERCQPA